LVCSQPQRRRPGDLQELVLTGDRAREKEKERKKDREKKRDSERERDKERRQERDRVDCLDCFPFFCPWHLSHFAPLGGKTEGMTQITSRDDGGGRQRSVKGFDGPLSVQQQRAGYSGFSDLDTELNNEVRVSEA